MASDLSEIDTVIYNTLAGDAALLAICPGGVHWDVANGVTAFVLLSRSPTEDYANALNGEDGWMRVTYLAKAVIQSKSVVDASNAGHRIHELLHRGLVNTTAGNYSVMNSERTIPIRYTEVDPNNTAARWQHHGGQYEVMVCPTN